MSRGSCTVAPPGGCNKATQAAEKATGDETEVQPASAKARAARFLARKGMQPGRNQRATGELHQAPHKATENLGDATAPAGGGRGAPHVALEIRLAGIAGRHGWTVGELAEACGSEWDWLRLRPEILEPVAAALAARQAIDRGEVPEGWTDTLPCPSCGPVPIWPGGGAVTDAVGCPWCRRRAQGLPVPAPTQPSTPSPNGQHNGAQEGSPGQGDASARGDA
jgi:hypothetical protein